MRRKTRILIVDQESLLRDGLRVLLELEDDLEMMGAIGSGDEPVDAAPTTGPHVVLLEFAMPSRMARRPLPSSSAAGRKRACSY